MKTLFFMIFVRNGVSTKHKKYRCPALLLITFFYLINAMYMNIMSVCQKSVKNWTLTTCYDENYKVV